MVDRLESQEVESLGKEATRGMLWTSLSSSAGPGHGLRHHDHPDLLD